MKRLITKYYFFSRCGCHWATRGQHPIVFTHICSAGRLCVAVVTEPCKEHFQWRVCGIQGALLSWRTGYESQSALGRQHTLTHTHTFSMSNRSFWFKFNGTKHSCTSAVVCLRFYDKISRRKSNGVSPWQAGVAFSSAADVSTMFYFRWNGCVSVYLVLNSQECRVKICEPSLWISLAALHTPPPTSKWDRDV